MDGAMDERPEMVRAAGKGERVVAGELKGRSIERLCDRMIALWEALPETLGEIDQSAFKALEWDWQSAKTVELLRRLKGSDPDGSLAAVALDNAETSLRQELETHPALHDHAPMLAALFKAECMLRSLIPPHAIADS
jgi:hypothetical protein